MGRKSSSLICIVSIVISMFILTGCSGKSELTLEEYNTQIAEIRETQPEDTYLKFMEISLGIIGTKAKAFDDSALWTQDENFDWQYQAFSSVYGVPFIAEVMLTSGSVSSVSYNHDTSTIYIASVAWMPFFENHGGSFEINDAEVNIESVEDLIAFGVFDGSDVNFKFRTECEYAEGKVGALLVQCSVGNGRNTTRITFHTNTK